MLCLHHPEVTKQGKPTERAILAANRGIELRGMVLGLEVIDVNKVLGSNGHRQAFQRDGLYISPRLGRRRGEHTGGKAVAFLGPR